MQVLRRTRGYRYRNLMQERELFRPCNVLIGEASEFRSICPRLAGKTNESQALRADDTAD
jgi:hypothetical protein